MTAWDLWDHRNRVLHAPNGPLATSELAQLDHQITQEYAQGNTGLRPLDRHLLQTPLASILSGTRSSQRKWLHSVRLARQIALPDPELTARTQMQRQQMLMRRWLQPVNPAQR